MALKNFEISNAVDLFPYLRFACLGPGRKKDRGFLEKPAQIICNVSCPRPCLIPGEFVRLGQDRNAGGVVLCEPLDQTHLIRAGISPDIEYEHDRLEIVPAPQVGLDHVPPGFLHPEGYLGISVTREIHQVEASVRAEEIDGLCPARRGTRSCQFLSICKDIDQGGFAYVGTAGKGHFRLIRRRILSYHKGAFEKFDVHVGPDII